MKNIKLIALIFLTTTTFNILFAIESGSTKDFALGANITLPLSNSFLEGCLFLKDDFWKQDFSLEKLDSLDLGFSFGLKDLKSRNSINLKIGRITYGGNLSNLTNPFLSASISPFYSSSCRISNITAALPNLSSSHKPVSYAIFAESDNAQYAFSKINFCGFYIPDERAALNFSAKFNGNKITLRFSNLNNLFYWNGNTNLSWFSKDFYSLKDFYFPSQILFSSNNQINLETKKYSALLSAGLFENPFGSFNAIWKFENKINYNKDTLNFSLLINKNELFTISGNGKKLDDCFQAKSNFQHQFIIKKKLPYFYKIGFAAYYKIPLIPGPLTQEIKTSCGIQITNPQFRFSSNFGYMLYFENSVIRSEEFNLQLKSAFYFEKITPGITCNLSIKKNGNNFSTTEDFKVTTTFFCNPRIYGSINYSLSQKNGKSYKNLWSTTISTKYEFDNGNMQAKINLK